MATAAAFRGRMAPRSGLADRALDWRTQARITVGELTSGLLQALRGVALRVYLVLRGSAYKKKGDTVRMGYAQIAAYVGADERTVRREIKHLISVGLLLSRRCFGLVSGWARPGDLPNEYTVLRPPEAVAALERRARREAGADDALDEDLGPLIVPMALDRSGGSGESLADQVARLSQVAALAMLPALEAQAAALESAAELLGQVPRFAPPSGWQRWRHYGAAQDCMRAISARGHAERALAAARVDLAEQLRALALEQPGPRGWSARLAELRLVLGTAGAAAALVIEASGAAERAGTTWAPLLVPVAAARAAQAELKLAPAADEGPAPRPSPRDRWEPPPGWAPSSGSRSVKTWTTHRTMWNQAQDLGAGGRVIRQRLRDQGFDPYWDDPE